MTIPEQATPALELCDIGANLTDPAFCGDLPAVLARARRQGVTRIVLTGTDVDTSRRALALARVHPGFLWSTAGVHPHHGASVDDAALQALHELLAAPEVVAVGECGLDYFRDLSPRDAQERAFRGQIALAVALQKPLFVHDRDAFPDVHRLLAERRREYPRAVVHCFTGDETALRGYLDLDLHIGITGWICDERRGLHLRELVRYVPRERLLLETDSPYLLPRTIRPKPGSRRNEPCFLPHVLAMVAGCLGEDPAVVAARTTATARAFFGLGHP